MDKTWTLNLEQLEALRNFEVYDTTAGYRIRIAQGGLANASGLTEQAFKTKVEAYSYLVDNVLTAQGAAA